MLEFSLMLLKNASLLKNPDFLIIRLRLTLYRLLLLYKVLTSNITSTKIVVALLKYA